MATLTTSKVASSVPYRTGLGLQAVFANYPLSAALALNDVIQMVKIPKGATVTDLRLDSTDVDTHVSPTIVFDVGDGNDTDRFIDGSTKGQTGGSDRIGTGITTNTHSNYTYTQDDTIDVLVQAGPATGATSGSIGLMVEYTMDT